jgi:hypothetical protein
MLASGATARSEPAVDSSRGYVAVGAVVGVGVTLYDAVSFEGGFRPGPYGLWLHVVLQKGDVGPAFSSQSGSEDAITSSGYWTLRAGIDKRMCLGGNVWCAIAGVDVGYLHEYAISQSSPQDLRGPVVVPHVAFDFGGRLRFRPEIEANVAHGIEAVAVTASIAYVW